MTCAELRARMVDPASSGQGRHAPVVDHLQICEGCRQLARAFGSIERIYRPDPFLELPPDTEKRVFDRILAAPDAKEAAPITKKLPVWAAWVMALAAIVVLVAFGLFVLRRPAPASAPTDRTAKGTRPSFAGTTPSAPIPAPTLVAETPARVISTSAPVTEEEKTLVGPLLDSSFLLGSGVLPSLDPFFPQDLSLGPVPDVPVPEKSPGEDADVTEKVLNWRHTAKAERDRILAAQKVFDARPPVEKQALRQRWTAWMKLSESDTPGLYRLASRLQELDPRRLEKTKAELRSIARLPSVRRMSAWRSSSFGRSVTGQEAAAAEKLWAAQK